MPLLSKGSIRLKIEENTGGSISVAHRIAICTILSNQQIGNILVLGNTDKVRFKNQISRGVVYR